MQVLITARSALAEQAVAAAVKAADKEKDAAISAARRSYDLEREEQNGVYKRAAAADKEAALAKLRLEMEAAHQAALADMHAQVMAAKDAVLEATARASADVSRAETEVTKLVAQLSSAAAERDNAVVAARRELESRFAADLEQLQAEVEALKAALLPGAVAHVVSPAENVSGEAAFHCYECGMSFSRLHAFNMHSSIAHGARAPHWAAVHDDTHCLCCLQQFSSTQWSCCT
jgi:hypothetical protein